MKVIKLIIAVALLSGVLVGCVSTGTGPYITPSGYYSTDFPPAAYCDELHKWQCPHTTQYHYVLPLQ